MVASWSTEQIRIEEKNIYISNKKTYLRQARVSRKRRHDLMHRKTLDNIIARYQF